MSPLERYLAKKKGEPNPGGAGNAKANEETRSFPGGPIKGDDRRSPQPKFDIHDEIEDLAIERGAPALPPPLPPHSLQSPGEESKLGPDASGVGVVAAGFGSRFLAYLADFVIVVFLMSVVETVLSVFISFIPGVRVLFTPDFLELVVFFGVTFFYYGWFYSEKKATPGKMLLGLEIVEAQSGERLGYVRTFFRETLGKGISSVLMGLGFLIAAFRGDRKALHDMIFETRVIEKPKH